MYCRYLRKALNFVMACILVFQMELFVVHAQDEVETRRKEIITVDGKRFKDLNGNGEIDPYENWQLSTEERVQNLLSQMTLEEKVGLLTINEFPEIQNGKLVFPNKFFDQHTRYFIYRQMPSADVIAEQMNQLQEEAEASRLGIPAVVISNP